MVSKASSKVSSAPADMFMNKHTIYSFHHMQTWEFQLFNGSSSLSSSEIFKIRLDLTPTRNLTPNFNPNLNYKPNTVGPRKQIATQHLFHPEETFLRMQLPDVNTTVV